MIASSAIQQVSEKRVAVSNLTVSNFRSYGHAKLGTDPSLPLKVLTGPNGAGKTNLLEAISFLSPGRGMRRASLNDITRHGSSAPWAVAAQVSVSNDTVKIGTGLDPNTFNQSDAHNKRIAKQDGEILKNSNQLGDLWSILWLTPQMDRIFIEGPSSRRRFLDRLVLGLYPDHSRETSAYERTMRERNKLISEQGSRADSAWLSALEAKMAEHGVAVAIKRLDFAGQLAGQLSSQENGPFPVATLAIDGWVEGLLADGYSAVDAETAFKDRLKSARSQEIALGKSASIGVHKTDLIVTHQSKNMPAELCSTGEQKALLIALIIANAKLQSMLRGQAPIMLLDEVAAHLDTDRRLGLFEILSDLGSQCWLTGTDRSIFDGIEKQTEFYTIQDGKIQPSA
ncbi:DNA replication/repair protein RecF [Kordiimonas sp. SCSIO 12610]|uniref:DNA replication/repair protein RecF n=1 Tax=Kordiimonas sp. SCSIO 12610 TaxID=2829597 RepID=UPI00210B179A|nr:DNA replication/repair protein RecF [Kordiimonas sp. SCSIO 12610]UTW55316.1 DNA replication/repair protein RecF [Kordiimonas sp. SCSIO 12610]